MLRTLQIYTHVLCWDLLAQVQEVAAQADGSQEVISSSQATKK